METNIKHVKLPKTRSDYPSRAILKRYSNAKTGTITLLYIEIHEIPKLSGLDPFQTKCSSNWKLDHPRYQVTFFKTRFQVSNHHGTIHRWAACEKSTKFTDDHCMAVNCQVFWTWKWQAKSRIGVIKSSNHDQVARSHLDLHKLHHELTSHLRRVLRYWWSCCRLSTSTYLWVDVIIPYSAGIFLQQYHWSSFWLTLQVIWTSKSFRREIKNMLYTI